jgi:hypothetical protein
MPFCQQSALPALLALVLCTGCVSVDGPRPATSSPAPAPLVPSSSICGLDSSWETDSVEYVLVPLDARRDTASVPPPLLSN